MIPEYSKKLEDLAETDPRFMKYRFDTRRGHFLYTEPGFRDSENKMHFIQGMSENDILDRLRFVEYCQCNQCKAAWRTASPQEEEEGMQIPNPHITPNAARDDGKSKQ